MKYNCLFKYAAVRSVTGRKAGWIVMSHKAGNCNGVFQLPIEGRVTRFMVGELKEAILPVIVLAEEIEIEIDLLRVTEIDFVGLLLLVEIKLSAITLGKTVRFIRYSTPVAEILGISGLTDFFNIQRFDKESILQKLGQVPDYMNEKG
ncbi:MAG: STAS domain-containing protein [Sideroxyarcus sp.]